MMKTKIISARVRIDEAERIKRLARHTYSRTIGESIRECLPSQKELIAFEWAKAVGIAPPGYRRWITACVAAVARQIMIDDPAYPVDPYFLLGSRDPEYHLAYFGAWIAARTQREPIPNPKADLLRKLSRGRFRIARPPRGGEWERRGVTGWAVLLAGQRFTPDGIEG